MQTLNSPGLRTGALARRTGYSAQQIRNLERDGVLPPADRTDAGYRGYREVHLRSVLAYRELAAGIGPVAAKDLLRAVHTRPVGEVLARLDAAHAGLDRERTEVGRARAAVTAIKEEPIDDVRPGDAMSVSELATALGLRASTLRHWDSEGLVVPDRVPPGGTRRYAPNQVRDARIVQQLRLTGYRIETLRAVLPELTGTGKAEVTAALAARGLSIENRSRALLAAAATLSSLLTDRDDRQRL
ncbi:MerR family transcriptional regulator [Microlunatus sp. GCM10028923]|uniref:MerR family transcriptional regulator n=1 Tax=Microlunatus sp. GCM10028923 TaxID=3273400 RepID=UPI00361C6C15